MTPMCLLKHYNWNGKVLLNRLYLFLKLKWFNPSFSVILYLLFNEFYFGHFQKKKKKKSNKQHNEPVITNTFFCFYHICRIVLRTPPSSTLPFNQRLVATALRCSIKDMLKSIDVWESIHQTDRKWTVAPFSNFYSIIWVGFYHNTGKHFFLEVSF